LPEGKTKGERQKAKVKSKRVKVTQYIPPGRSEQSGDSVTAKAWVGFKGERRRIKVIQNI
jgi:hypothetical protein